MLQRRGGNRDLVDEWEDEMIADAIAVLVTWIGIGLVFGLLFGRHINNQERRMGMVAGPKTAITEVILELDRARTEHPVFPDSPVRRIKILLEEVTEVALALTGDGDLRAELAQVAATAIRWMETL